MQKKCTTYIRYADEKFPYPVQRSSVKTVLHLQRKGDLLCLVETCGWAAVLKEVGRWEGGLKEPKIVPTPMTSGRKCMIEAR